MTAGCQLSACPLPAYPRRPPSRPDTSRQALGHFMCPFIALNGEGLPARGLKGPEAGRLQAQWEVCVWRLVGVGTRRSWVSHLSPNSWVGLRPTLFLRSECCRGPGSTAPTPRPASKRKPCEERAIFSGSGRNKLPVTGSNQSQASQNPIRVYTALNLGCTCLSQMPRRGLGDFHPDCSLPPLRPDCHLEVPVPPPTPPTAWAGGLLGLETPKGCWPTGAPVSYAYKFSQFPAITS